MNKTRHKETGCIDGMLPVSPIIRRPSVHRCPLCREEDDKAISAEEQARADEVADELSDVLNDL